MPQSNRPITTLKNRTEFQRVRGGGRATALAFVLEGKKRKPDETVDRDAISAPPGARFGFTITKKVGNAVTRNKMRRRLRSALGDIANDCADPEMDYVVVARPPAAIQNFATLKADLQTAFERVHRPQRSKPSKVSSPPRSPQKP